MPLGVAEIMNFISRLFNRRVLLVSISLMLVHTTGNTTSRNDRLIKKLERDDTGAVRILIMPPDINIFKQSVNRDLVPDNARIARAQENLIGALKAALAKRNIDPVLITTDTQATAKEDAYQRLQWAISQTVVDMHLKGEHLKTKNDSMSWTLGSGVSFLREKYSADYALFTYYLDVKASLLNQPAAASFAFVTMLAIIPLLFSGGKEEGIATLVDLRSGDTIWANQIPLGHGDLTQDQKLVYKSANELLINMPN
jgi:hypothetical protein